jgi:hypothetical protein
LTVFPQRGGIDPEFGALLRAPIEVAALPFPPFSLSPAITHPLLGLAIRGIIQHKSSASFGGMAIYLRDYGNLPEAQEGVDDYF